MRVTSFQGPGLALGPSMQAGALHELALTASGRLGIMEPPAQSGAFTHDIAGAFQVCQPPSYSGDSGIQQQPRPKRTAARSSSAGEPDTDERIRMEEIKAQKVKEKNKRAQQRFRERQKAKSTETQSEVARLRMQVSQLQSALHDEQHSRRLLDHPHTAQQGSLQDVPMQPQLKTECKVPEGNVFEPRFGWEMVQPESSLLLSLCADGPRSFTPEQLRTRQYNDHAALWKEYVELLATNLVEAQGDESSAAAGRVRGLVNELTGYACTMLKLNAEVMHNFMSREANAGSAASLQWRHILKALELSDGQKKDLMTARHFCLTSLGNLLHERQQLVSTLQSGLSDAHGLRGICQQQLGCMDLMQHLHRNLANVNETYRHFMHILHKRVLTTFQLATVIVQAYPAASDMLAFVNHIAAELGQPPQNELLHPQVAQANTSSSLRNARLDTLSHDEVWNALKRDATQQQPVQPVLSQPQSLSHLPVASL